MTLDVEEMFILVLGHKLADPAGQLEDVFGIVTRPTLTRYDLEFEKSVSNLNFGKKINGLHTCSAITSEGASPNQCGFEGVAM